MSPKSTKRHQPKFRNITVNRENLPLCIWCMFLKVIHFSSNEKCRASLCQYPVNRDTEYRRNISSCNDHALVRIWFLDRNPDGHRYSHLQKKSIFHILPRTIETFLTSRFCKLLVQCKWYIQDILYQGKVYHFECWFLLLSRIHGPPCSRFIRFSWSVSSPVRITGPNRLF